MIDRWLDKYEMRLRRYTVPHLTTTLTILMALVFITGTLPHMPMFRGLARDLYFSRTLILRGQIWRLLTFVLVPTGGSLISVALELYLFFLVGNSLENAWGAYRFDIFYLCGLLGCIISGFVTGSATGYFLNMSLFFAFAILYPDFTINLFYVLPLRAKYIALLIGALLAVNCVTDVISGHWGSLVEVAFSLLNVWLFFGTRLPALFREYKRRSDWKKHFR